MRLKTRVLNKMIEELTSAELSLLVFVIERSDLSGYMEELTMSSFIKETDYSKQTFYNSLYSLENKGFICVDYKNATTYSIFVLDNRFKDEENTNKESYILLSYAFLKSKEFHSLSCNLKKFILRSYGFIKSKHWRVTNEILKQFRLSLSDLQPYFTIQLTSSGIYLKHKEILTKKNSNVLYLHYYHFISRFLNRHHLSCDLSNLTDSVQVLLNNRKYRIYYREALLACTRLDDFSSKYLNKVITNFISRFNTTQYNLSI